MTTMALVNGIRKHVTVEPLVFTFMFCLFFISPIEEQLFYAKSCYQLYNNTICDGILHGSRKTVSFQHVVQQETSRWILYTSIIITVPSILTTLLLGSISDQVGRKFLICVPFLGNTLRVVGLILNSYYIDWPVPYTFIGITVSGICGNYATILTGALAYIADTTKKESRTLRVCILESMLCLGGALGEFLGGILVDRSGFARAFIVALAVYVASLIYILLYLQESYHPTRDKELGQLVCAKGHLSRVIRVTLRTRENSRRMHILLLLLTFIIQIMVFNGGSGISILYVRLYPLMWSPTMVGYYLSSSLITKGVTTLIVLPIMLRALKIDDHTVIVGGLFSTMASLLAFGFATKTWMVFLSVAVGIAGGANVPCIRAMISKMVDKSEQGSLMAAVSCGDIIASLVAHLVFDNLYYATVSWFPGVAFFIMAGLQLPMVFVVWFLQVRHDDGVIYIAINDTKHDTSADREVPAHSVDLFPEEFEKVT